MKSKYNDLLVNYNQLKEEKEKQALLHSEEVAKREGAEQQLAKAKSDLVELQAEHDEGFQIVVCAYCIHFLLSLLYQQLMCSYLSLYISICIILQL